MTTDPARVPGALWRSVVAVGLIILTVLGTVALTDDSWPFAPFHMFSHAVDPDGRVVKVDFLGTTGPGRTVQLDAEAFGLRRAEVEGQQGRGGRLPPTQLAALFDSWNRRHPEERLTRLDLRLLGRRLQGGKPVSSYSRIVQTYPPEDAG